MVTSNIMFNWGPEPPREGEIWGGGGGRNPQFAAMPPIAKLLKLPQILLANRGRCALYKFIYLLTLAIALLPATCSMNHD